MKCECFVSEDLLCRMCFHVITTTKCGTPAWQSRHPDSCVPRLWGNRPAATLGLYCTRGLRYGVFTSFECWLWCRHVHMLDIHTLGVFLCPFQNGIPKLCLTQHMWMPRTQLLFSLVPLTKERCLSHLFLLNGPFPLEAFVRF